MYCYFCGGQIPPLGIDDFVIVSNMVTDGPYAKPTRICCWDCFDRHAFMNRGKCQFCGVLKSLLYRENTSMTTSWRNVGKYTLCGKCTTDLTNPLLPADLSSMPKYPDKVLLTDDDIAVLKKCWKLPDWKTRTKMPNLKRGIDDI